MSFSLSSLAGPATYGSLSQLVTNSGSIHQQLNTLTQQVSNGLVSTTYAGLGQGAAVSLSLNPQLTALQTWQNNIGAATGSMQVTQTVLSQISQIASNFYAQINNLNGLNASNVTSVAASANSALQQVANLLDSTDGAGNYVFAGQDSSNPPVPNPDAILSSGFYTQINAAVGALSTNGAAATAASTLAIASSNAAGTSPFSAYLSQPAGAIATPSVQVGDGQQVSIGILASANAAVASTGSSTTGSYMRDVMRGLATLGSLSASQISDPGFAGLVADTQTSLGGAVTALNQDAGVLGNQQTMLTATQTTLSDTATALTTQVSAVQDVNMAQTISKLQLVQTQLQASYQVIASLKGLSLAAYL